MKELYRVRTVAWRSDESDEYYIGDKGIFKYLKSISREEEFKVPEGWVPPEGWTSAEEAEYDLHEFLDAEQSKIRPFDFPYIILNDTSIAMVY